MSIQGEVELAQKNPLDVVRRYRAQLELAMPTSLGMDGNRWVRLAEAAVNRNPQLVQIVKADQGASLMQALAECARLGHEPGSKEFYLVPKGNRIEGWESYRGIIKRILRSGQYSRVVKEVVFEKDFFQFNPNEHEIPNHKFEPFEPDRGKPISAYAYAVRWDGTPTAVAIATPALIRASKSKARGTDRPDSPWNQADGVMYLKVAVRQLEKFAEASSEDLRTGREQAEGEVPEPSDWDYGGEVIDVTDSEFERVDEE